MTNPRKPVPDGGGDNLKRNPLKGASKIAHPHIPIPTKPALVAGMGERNDEVVAAMRDRRAHGCDLLTAGQYLRPGGTRLAIERCVNPNESARNGQEPGVRRVTGGRLVHSSCHYHAEHQARSL